MSFYTLDLSVLSLTYLLYHLISAVYAPNVKGKEFGGTDPGDNYASLLDGTRKPFTQFVHDGVVQEFDFRQYLFSRQAQVFNSIISVSQDAKIIIGQSKDSVSLNNHVDFPNCDLHHSI